MFLIKKIPHRPAFVLLLVAVMMTMVCSHLVLFPPTPHQKQFYSYGPFITSSANILQAGGQVTITWTAHPDAPNPSSTEAALKLEVVLISTSSFRALPSCEKARDATVIDQITTTNTAGQSFTRHVAIPSHMQPGQYELVRKIWSATGSVCFGTTVTVVPAHLLPHVPIIPPVKM
jgi:hypothetical protein